MRWLRDVRVFAVALVMLVVVSVVVLPSHSETSALRISHLEQLVRCPACEGLSAAQSNATSAVAVRHEIEKAVAQGKGDTEILGALEARYGTSILLSPSTSGFGMLLWLVPILLIAVALVGLGIAWRRRS
jgi:cytochrome c-type biogenesis protein CcmH/NrfF